MIILNISEWSYRVISYNNSSLTFAQFSKKVSCLSQTILKFRVLHILWKHWSYFELRRLNVEVNVQLTWVRLMLIFLRTSVKLDSGSSSSRSSMLRLALDDCFERDITWLSADLSEGSSLADSQELSGLWLAGFGEYSQANVPFPISMATVESAGWGKLLIGWVSGITSISCLIIFLLH